MVKKVYPCKFHAKKTCVLPEEAVGWKPGEKPQKKKRHANRTKKNYMLGKNSPNLTSPPALVLPMAILISNLRVFKAIINIFISSFAKDSNSLYFSAFRHSVVYRLSSIKRSPFANNGQFPNQRKEPCKENSYNDNLVRTTRSHWFLGRLATSMKSINEIRRRTFGKSNFWVPCHLT